MKGLARVDNSEQTTEMRDGSERVEDGRVESHVRYGVMVFEEDGRT